MGLISIFIGVIAVLLSFVPMFSYFLLFVLGMVGLIVGLVAWSRQRKLIASEPLGYSIAGITLNSTALCSSLLWSLIILAFRCN